MKRLAIFCLAIGAVLGSCLTVQAQSGNGCYGGAYQGAEQSEPFALSAIVPGQTQTVTIPLQVTITTPALSLPVAAPAPVCPSVGFAPSFAQPYATVQCPGFSGNFGFGVHQNFNTGFANRGFNGGFNQGFNQRFGAIGGTGISVSARDRRGNQVIANGANSVRIRRGLLGRINGADADVNRGLLGRISPF